VRCGYVRGGRGGGLRTGAEALWRRERSSVFERETIVGGELSRKLSGCEKTLAARPEKAEKKKWRV